jgi:hypothetical protein
LKVALSTIKQTNKQTFVHGTEIMMNFSIATIYSVISIVTDF